MKPERERSTARPAVREVSHSELEGESVERREKKLKGGLRVPEEGLPTEASRAPATFFAECTMKRG